MEKYGFIYIWYDRKRKMFYLGAHWGAVNDGYICSSDRMRKAYRRRPQDFTRRIIEKGLLREETYSREKEWLSLIREDELGIRYYNLRNYETRGGSSFTPEALERIRQSSKERWNNGTFSEESIEKMRKANSGKKFSEETKLKMSRAAKGRTKSKEHRKKLSDATKRQFSDPVKKERHRQAMLKWQEDKKVNYGTKNY